MCVCVCVCLCVCPAGMVKSDYYDIVNSGDYGLVHCLLSPVPFESGTFDTSVR